MITEKNTVVTIDGREFRLVFTTAAMMMIEDRIEGGIEALGDMSFLGN